MLPFIIPLTLTSVENKKVYLNLFLYLTCPEEHDALRGDARSGPITPYL
jgi:hypothetical protein